MAAKLKPVNFPVKDALLDQDGKLVRVWRDELVNLQIVINALVDKFNNP